MESQSEHQITLEDVLVEEIQSQTVELPLTKHVMLRITPQDWAAGVVVLGESLVISKDKVDSLKKKIQEATK